MRLIDTNILVHAVDEESPLMERAQEVLNYYIGTGEAAIALQSILEMYAALTKSRDPTKARLAAERVLRGTGFKKLEPDKGAYYDALVLAERNCIKRSDVFDALLVAIAKRNGIETILTENAKHFEMFDLNVETLETATLSKKF